MSSQQLGAFINKILLVIGFGFFVFSGCQTSNSNDLPWVFQPSEKFIDQRLVKSGNLLLAEEEKQNQFLIKIGKSDLEEATEKVYWQQQDSEN